MTKPRAMAVVLITAAAGYVLAARGDFDLRAFGSLILGTALSGGGSIVLNQWWERHHDARMVRTRDRALPSGRISPGAALAYGTTLSIAGTSWLAWQVNGISALLGALCVLTYVLLYTPLKRVTSLNAVVGAVPGAIPPMMGWTAATGSVGLEAWLLFLILFVWQFPHFLAIGWLHRRDYAGAGYAMLSAADTDGSMTARQMVLNCACLMVVSLMPTSLAVAGSLYALGAMILGFGLLILSFAFSRRPDDRSARVMLAGTIVHISGLMLLLVLDRAA